MEQQHRLAAAVHLKVVQPDDERRPEKSTPRNDYLVVTHWESREFFDAWNGSEEYKQGHSRVGEFRGADGKVALRSTVEQYEVIAR
jgi:heme-degrading monooxygenase HmoA